MQAKGLIKFFVIVLSVICLYQLSFTYFAKNLEKHAEDVAAERVDTTGISNDPVKIQQRIEDIRIAYLDSIYNEPVFELGPISYTYQEIKKNEISLGLDLQGGLSVVLQVSLKEKIIALSNDSKDPQFLAALDEANKMQTSSDADYVTLFAQAYAAQPNARPLYELFATQQNAKKVKYGDTNEQVIQFLHDETKDAIQLTYEVIKNRIDEFGVTQPNVSLQEGSNRILVELPGIDNPKRARTVLQSTAKLEFWEMYENVEVNSRVGNMADFLGLANEAYRDKLGLMDTTTVDTTAAASNAMEEFESDNNTDETDNLTAAPDDSTSLADDTSDLGDLGDLLESGDSLANQAKNDSVDKIMYPLVGGNTSPLIPAVYQGDKGLQWAPGPVIGYAYSQNKDKVEEILNDEDVKAVFPKGVQFAWGAKPVQGNMYALYALMASNKANMVVGANIDDAYASVNPVDGQPEVNMRMDPDGARKWSKITKENINHFIAIVLDGKVYSAPRVNSQIDGGSSVISGSFTIAETQDLASIIRAGDLPAPARIVQEEFVGPSLGAENIRAGLISLIVGLVAVLIFMVIYYNRSGFIADLALVLNILFILGTLSSYGASLTLPGMAGIVLTIGMAVDANVIIFERIREELRKGKGLRLAIAEGFDKSYSAIIDANVTTLITAAFLLSFGIGPVKGFAFILLIGIISSFVTAVLASRILMENMSAGDKGMSFSTKLTENILVNANFQFISKRKLAYVISSSLIIIGIISIVVQGFDKGVDFTGGRKFVVNFENSVSNTDIQDALTVPFGSTPAVKSYGAGNRVEITTNFMIDSSSTIADSVVEAKLYEGLKGFYDGDISYKTFDEKYKEFGTTVGPTIADDLAKKSFTAAIFSFIGIFLYLLLRFRNWQFGFAALVAVVHDAMVMLGLFSLLKSIMPFSLELDQAFIAALLTVIGYSINDTVIVFDRVREYMFEHPSKPLADVSNMAINSTLSRTLMTSFTTLLVVIILFLFGGEGIKAFSFALLVGIVAGTYSSIFVATPIVVDMVKNRKMTVK